MAQVTAVNISERKGVRKHEVPYIDLKLRHGIVGDAHAGDWHRQISLLAEESVDTMRAVCPIALDAGIFAENINTRGIELKTLPVGTHLRVGETELEVTQIGKQCHNDCEIKRADRQMRDADRGHFCRCGQRGPRAGRRRDRGAEMKLIRTEDAVGHVLCHDMTQIIKDKYKDARFRKGHVVTEEDIPVLLSMGKAHLYVWEMTPGMVHENDAAEASARRSARAGHAPQRRSRRVRSS